jgi:two-component system cell cycle sensor histidine kinase/response regulator CckA
MSKILLVDDEDLILTAVKEFLEMGGYSVFAAATGGEMLRILADQNGEIDLLLLDLTLPDMNGLDLIPQLSIDYPSLKVVIWSGALPDELEFEDQPFIKAVLSKPFDLRELREIIDRTLGG